VSTLFLGASKNDPFDQLVRLESSMENHDPMKVSDLYERLHSFKNALDTLPDLEWCNRSYSGEYCKKVTLRRAELERLIKADQSTSTNNSPGLSDRLKQPRLMVYEELELPLEYQSVNSEGETSSLLKKFTQLNNFSVVSVSSVGIRILAISVSQDIDPRGEVSSGGYWAHLSNDGGGTWDVPYYLGFAEQFPYVVQTNSKLPPFNDNSIQIPVELREVDEDSISFPPVGLRAKRTKSNLYLKIPVDALRLDSDKDGLTDLYEEKIASDPHQKDTDKDGILDSSDPQPLSPQKTGTSEADEVIVAAFKEMLWGNAIPIQQSAVMSQKKNKECLDSTMTVQNRPFNSQRVLFIHSDERLLSGYDLPTRTVILSTEAEKAYNKKFGPTYMLTISEIVFNVDHTRAFFNYNFGWEGGSFTAKKVKGKWIVRREHSWVT